MWRLKRNCMLRKRTALVLAMLLVLVVAAIKADTIRRNSMEPEIRLFISADGSVIELPLE